MNNRKLLSVSLTILIAVAMLALVAPAVSAQDQGSIGLTDGELHQEDVQTDQVTADDGPINISVEPAELTAAPGGTSTYDIMVENATDGISGYNNLNITIQDPSIATFTDFSEDANDNVPQGGQAPLSQSEIRQNGAQLYLSAALADGSFSGAQEIRVATVDIEATGSLNDQTSVAVESGAGIQDNNGNSYTVNNRASSSYGISFDMSLDFDDQEVQPGDTVVVDNVDSDGQTADLLVTYTNSAGDTVVAGVQTGTFASESVGVQITDDGGFTTNPSGDRTGSHTAHILPNAQASSDYSGGDVVSSSTASSIIDSDSATITDPAIPDLTGLDISIEEGLSIGDDYPLNQRSMFAQPGSIYGDSGLSLPSDAEDEDQRFLPIADGQHVGLGGLPIQDEVYQWLNVSSAGYPSSTLLNYQPNNPSQTVAVSFEGDESSPVVFDYSEAAAHGLEIDSFSVDSTANINTGDFTSTIDRTANQITIDFDETAVGPSSPTIQYVIDWEAVNPVEGLDVNEPNGIDYETDHRVIAPDADQVRDNFVTFEAGATGISHADTNNANNGFIGEPADAVDLESLIDTDGAADGTSNDGSFLVWEDQRVTFETAAVDNTIEVYETAIDEDGNYTLGDQVDEAQIGFDDTAPGQIANLNTNNLTADEQYFVTFGQDKANAIVLDVRPLDLEASSTDAVPTSELDDPLELDVTSDDTTGGNVEAWVVKEPVVEANDTTEVLHVERDELTGTGDREMELIPSVDLAGAGDYTATILHTESGVTTTTEFTLGGVAPPTAIEFADDINIVSPSLDAPDEPGRFDRGDIIPIELELEGGNAGTITFGNAEEENVEVHATVYNTDYTPTDAANNVDTTVTVYLSTYHIGHGFVNQNTTADPSGYTTGDLNLTLNTPPYPTAAPGDRNHGFFTEPSSDSALVPDARLARSENVFAHGSMDIYGGSQSGAVLSSRVSYDLHAASSPTELPYTLIGDDREEDRDDINFLDVGPRSTENFQYWRAPGQGVNSLNNRLPTNITTGDIASLVDEGVITPLETNDDGEFVDQLAEDDFIIVQAQSTGLEGVMLESVLRDPDTDGAIGDDLQEYVDTIQGDSVDEEISLEFGAANSMNFDRPVTVEEGEPPYAANTMLDYQFSLVETQASVDERFQLTGPNVAQDAVSRIVPTRNRLDVVADLNFDQTSSDYYVPYQITENLPVPTGDTTAPDLEFGGQAVLDARGGAQSNDRRFSPAGRTISLADNDLLSGPGGVANFTALDYVQATVSFDGVHVDNGEIQVPTNDEYTVSGTTTMAPGTEVNVRLLSDLDEATPFLKVEEGITVTPQDDSPLSAWEGTFDFSETRDGVQIQGGTVFEADVLRTGGNTVSGGDDVPGLVLNDQNVETFEFSEQRSDGETVSVTAFESNRVAQITIEDAEGNELGTSDVLPRNQLQEQFNIVLDEPIESNQQVTAVAEVVQPDPAQLNDTVLAEQTADVLIEDQAEAFFSVSDLSPQTASVEQGAEVTVEATVTNMGDQEGTQSISLDIDGISFDESVTLAGGESTTVSFTADTGGVDPGEYTHTLSSDDDSVAGALTIEAQPEPGVLEIISLSPSDATVTQGDEVVVDVSIQNVGETEATEDVVLEVSGLGEVGSQSVTLGAGEADAVTFTVGTGEVDAGDYTHTVSTAEDSAEGSLTIESPPPEDDSTDNGSDDDGGDGSGPGFGIAAAALALLGAALLAMRRRAE